MQKKNPIEFKDFNLISLFFFLRNCFIILNSSKRQILSVRTHCSLLFTVSGKNMLIYVVTPQRPTLRQTNFQVTAVIWKARCYPNTASNKQEASTSSFSPIIQQLWCKI